MLACAGDEDKDGCGLNIEGIAVDSKENVFLGLRAPSLDGKAFIVRTKADELFADGHERAPSNATVDTLPVALGDDVGIRDLALLPDGRLLILAGAAYQPDIPYSIFVVDRSGANLQELLAEQKPTRAEAMTVLGATPQEIRLLLLFNGKLDGEPQEVRVPLP